MEHNPPKHDTAPRTGSPWPWFLVGSIAIFGLLMWLAFSSI